MPWPPRQAASVDSSIVIPGNFNLQNAVYSYEGYSKIELQLAG
jgi:hypothetical protein